MRNSRIVAISNEFNPDENFDYANVSVWNPEIFQRIPPRQKVSFIPILIKWISQGGRIGGVVLDDGQWFNIGSRSEYLEVHRVISQEGWKPGYVKASEWPQAVAKTADVDPTAKLRGCSVVGEHCRVGAQAILEDTILWPGAQIASQSQLQGCIIRSQKKVSGIHRNIDI
jgi:mannose-1-phosphate guanylyltransferase